MRSLLNSCRVANSSSISPFCRHAFSTFIRQTARVPSKGRPKIRLGPPPGPQRGLAQRLAIPEELAAARHNGGIVPNKKSEANRTFVVFKKLVLTQFYAFLNNNPWSKKQDEYAALGVNTAVDFEREAKLFRQTINAAFDLASKQFNNVTRKDNPIFWSLRNAFVTGDVLGLQTELKYSFNCFLMRSRFTPSVLATHQEITDMRFPYEWFPATRATQRIVHLHVGPTNSGKTYNALKALENAKSGIYAGPLRLLAHEVYSRFTAKGKTCALVTGEEQRIPEDVENYFKSCTVEMTPVNQAVDVAVIDEIQMIGDSDRGWAWTQAFLGVRAKEVHLCGEERTVELIKSLCATLGDKLEIHHYKRLSELKTMDVSLKGDLDSLEKGDAIVSFSRIGIHSLKNQIEQRTGKRCAIVYGSLPPETRANQAALFNNPDNDYDYLVASDAIGMGLNLDIKRVIFESTYKRDVSGYRQISVPEIKQIGGRAGRFKTAGQATETVTLGDKSAVPKPKPPGLVTAIEPLDLAVLEKAFKSEVPPLETAGIQPPTAAIERLSTYFPPNTPLSFILLRFRDIAKLSSRFHLCHMREALSIADLIQPFPMTIYDRCVFLNAPVFLREEEGPRVLQAMAQCVSKMEGGNLLDMREIDLELLDKSPRDLKLTATRYLGRLETLHKSITLYLWLSYRFTGIFTSQHLAFHVKRLLEIKINEHLGSFSQSLLDRRKRLEKIRRETEARKRDREELLAADALVKQANKDATV
ncbi:P-loop containing nucleoside triphosphate hydrolase protein [Xylaria sp. CBS 124048]|nr:P-loop containing nucleoside triphosphate hydrolase protein [Xylaria sp. CBS 124048]